jgi:small subunit ribosomal protein S17
MSEAKQVEEKGKKKLLVGTRGRVFQGFVIKKFGSRVVIEFERTVYVPKYERFTRKKTKLHARIPEKMNVEIGNYIKIRECRPLSKIVHFIVVDVLKKNIEEEGE